MRDAGQVILKAADLCFEDAEDVLCALMAGHDDVHLHRNPDGTVSVTPMRQVDICGVHHDDIWLEPSDGDGEIDGTDSLWVDVEAGAS